MAERLVAAMLVLGLISTWNNAYYLYGPHVVVMGLYVCVKCEVKCL